MKKDPIKALEILKDFNEECSKILFRPLKHDWPQFYSLAKEIGGLFIENQKILNEVIKEMKKQKKAIKQKRSQLLDI